MQPHQVLGGAIASLELIRDVLGAAAEAVNDRRFEDALVRLDRALDALRGR